MTANKTKLKSKKRASAAPPTPIIPGLAEIGDPYRHSQTRLNTAVVSNDLPSNAKADYEAVIKFLFGYNGSSATFKAYRRELERLLQWCWRIEKRTAIGLAREDIEAFVRFCLEPPESWIGDAQAARFFTIGGELQPNPAWRPFSIRIPKNQTKSASESANVRYTPSEAAVRATFTALSSFYDWLTEEGLMEANPVALIRQKSKFLKKHQNTAIVRRISNLQWDYVIDTVEAMANADPTYERTLFIMNCLFGLYLRISELVADERSNPSMGDFRKDQDGAWWFHVTGKGNKDRTITVSDAMLDALKRYRESRGLPPLPILGETEPLIPKTRGFGPVTSTRQIRRIVQDCFDAAYARMVADGLGEDALELRAATVHWLRHTGISEDVKIRPREHVRDDAGHATMATTDRYIESDRRERHASARKKPLKDL